MLSLDGYQAARERSVVADRSGRGTIVITGGDRISLLHNLLTNDIADLGPGRGCYSAYLTPQGRMIADMRVVVRDDRVLLDVEPSVTHDLLERLDLSIFAEDVQVADRTASTAILRVAGPASVATIAGAFGNLFPGLQPVSDEMTALGEYDSREWMVNHRNVVIVRDDSLGVIGYDVLIGCEHAAELEQALQAAGAVAIEEPTFEVLRIEAGRPRFGVDMDSDTIPLEAGIEQRAISFTKGCYPGQEVIVRILHRGHGRVARRLVGLTLDGETMPSPADSIVAAENVIGRVTSVAWSPALARSIALGYVQRGSSDPGTRVAIEHAGARVEAVVSPLPFRSIGI